MMHQKAAISIAVFQQRPTSVPSDESARTANPKSSSHKSPPPIGTIRIYLTTFSPAALDAEARHNELAMRAKIIQEYMATHSIADVNHGIRAFTAFERERLYRLGIIAPIKTRALRAR